MFQAMQTAWPPCSHRCIQHCTACFAVLGCSLCAHCTTALPRCGHSSDHPSCLLCSAAWNETLGCTLDNSTSSCTEICAIGCALQLPACVLADYASALFMNLSFELSNPAFNGTACKHYGGSALRLATRSTRQQPELLSLACCVQASWCLLSNHCQS